MNGDSQNDDTALAEKIARLVQERGWNQEVFARIANLNRQTVRQILQQIGSRTLRNETVGKCAQALNLTVNELRHWPIERLLPRMHSQRPGGEDAVLRRLYDQATQPELRAWLERNEERGKRLTEAEIEELLSLQGTGGPLTTIGVEHFVNVIERRRRLMEKVQVVANTELVDVLEKLVDLMYEKVQPYQNRN